MIQVKRIYMENTTSRNAFWEMWVVRDEANKRCFNALRFGSLNGFGKLECRPMTPDCNFYGLWRKAQKDSSAKADRDYRLAGDGDWAVDSADELAAKIGKNGRQLAIALFKHLGAEGNAFESDISDEVEPTVPEPVVVRSESWGSW